MKIYLTGIPADVEGTISLSHLSTWSSDKQQNSMVMDNKSLKCYAFELSTQLLLKYFLQGNPSTRLAILHASMAHFNMKRFVFSHISWRYWTTKFGNNEILYESKPY